MDVSSLPSATFDQNIHSSMFAKRRKVNVVSCFCLCGASKPEVRSQSEPCSMCVRNMSDVVADVMAGGSKSGRVFLFDFNTHTPHVCLFRSHADAQTCAGKEARGREMWMDCGKEG